MNDFDWPPIPYREHLQRELHGLTQYDYLNSALDRRYDPVVVGGNAMDPVIQSGDVVLIDTGEQNPEDGRAVAVRVDGGRTVIGYWHSDGPVLLQHRTDKVIDLSTYQTWSIYGTITKVIGRDVRPRVVEVRCTMEETMPDVTPGQAQYVIQRLLDERRISEAEVRGYVTEIGNEIASIEHRLASLRASVGSGPVNLPTRRVAPTRTLPKVRGQKGHPRGIAGTLAVLLRAIPAAEHAAIAAIRSDKGIKAAIKAAKAAAKKA